jgi:tetratricopeptide (TPR) repeat protein
LALTCLAPSAARAQKKDAPSQESPSAAAAEASPESKEPQTLVGPEVPDAWSRAQRAYQEGRFKEALELFLQTEYAVRGQPRLELWHNIGTTLARLGDQPRAALYLRRVLARDPLHAGARKNLRFLGLRAEPLGQAGKLGFLQPYFDPVAKLLSARAWLAISLGFWAGAIILNWLGRRGKRRGMGRLAWLIALGGLLTALPLAWTWHANRAFASGTILRNVEARSGPGRSFPEIYDLKAGETVWLPSYKHDGTGFSKVFLPNNDTGFVVDDAIEPH